MKTFLVLSSWFFVGSALSSCTDFSFSAKGGSPRTQAYVASGVLASLGLFVWHNATAPPAPIPPITKSEALSVK